MCEGKATLVKLTTRLQEDDGLPVTGMKSHRLYAARRAVEAEHHMVYAEKFAALPRYLYDICRKNPGSWQDIQINEHTGEFMAAFFAFGPAVELMKTVGWDATFLERTSGTLLLRYTPNRTLKLHHKCNHTSIPAHLRYSKVPMVAGSIGDLTLPPQSAK